MLPKTDNLSNFGSVSKSSFFKRAVESGKKNAVGELG